MPGPAAGGHETCGPELAASVPRTEASPDVPPRDDPSPVYQPAEGTLVPCALRLGAACYTACLGPQLTGTLGRGEGWSPTQRERTTLTKIRVAPLGRPQDRKAPLTTYRGLLLPKGAWGLVQRALGIRCHPMLHLLHLASLTLSPHSQTSTRMGASLPWPGTPGSDPQDEAEGVQHSWVERRLWAA